MFGPAAEWGDAEDLLATTVDWLGHIDYLLRAAHFKGTPDPPEPVPRPSGNGAADGEVVLDYGF